MPPKHNPKLNPQAPYANPEVHALPLAERRKVAVSIFIEAVKRSDGTVPTDRSIRKACDLSGRQFRKAKREASEYYE